MVQEFFKVVFYGSAALSFLSGFYVVGKIAKMKGRNPIGWGVFYFFTPLIALISINHVKPLPEECDEYCRLNKIKIKKLFYLPAKLLYLSIVLVIIWVILS